MAALAVQMTDPAKHAAPQELHLGQPRLQKWQQKASGWAQQVLQDSQR
jgi:hypothetical protein